MSKPGTATSAADAHAMRVWFDAELVHITLVDGRELTDPLAAHPRLRDASATDRAHWRLIGEGGGIHWPAIDEDISVAGLLEGN